MPARAVALKGVGRQWACTLAGRDVTFEVPAGGFVSIVGPSGCGKSTVLNMIAGLPRPRPAPSMFSVSRSTVSTTSNCTCSSRMPSCPGKLCWIIFRSDFSSVAAIGARPGRGESLARARGLKGFGDSYPYQLSGGMRKRVAMAQCWIVQPDMVSMDEPFGALDVHTRLRMESEILRALGRHRERR